MKGVAASEARILEIFAWLFAPQWIRRWCRRQPGAPRWRERCFTLRITLWCMIWQRLCGGAPLDAVMAHARSGGLDGLGPARGGKLSRRLPSVQTAAYNAARQRLPLALVRDALQWTASKLREKLEALSVGDSASPAQCRSRVLMDGSTLRMLATPELVQRFACARTRQGDSDWCLMRVCVAFCCHSGAALYASLASREVSEQTMAGELIRQGARATIWIGDRNFGVWSVAAQARTHGQDVLVRLTRKRARALAAQGSAPERCQGDRRVRWIPSRKTHVPEGCAHTVVEGRLIQACVRRGRRWVRLWLFTTLLDAELFPVELLVRWYGQRWGAELNFRSLKTHLALAHLRVTSAEMAEREFGVGLLTYNLIRSLMWQSLPPDRSDPPGLSFSQARHHILEAMEMWTLGPRAHTASAPNWLRKLLRQIVLCRLPRRRRPRPSQPRIIRRRAQSKFPEFRGSRALAAACHRTAERRRQRLEKPISRDA